MIQYLPKDTWLGRTGTCVLCTISDKARHITEVALQADSVAAHVLYSTAIAVNVTPSPGHLQLQLICSLTCLSQGVCGMPLCDICPLIQQQSIASQFYQETNS